LKLIQTEEGYKTVGENELPEYKDVLHTVFENGRVLKEENFEQIRARVKDYNRTDAMLVNN
jgi:nicotinamide phosphoribosyltransferase